MHWLASIFIFLGSLFSTHPAVPVATPASIATKAATYTNTTDGYSVTVPTGWTLNPAHDSATAVTFDTSDFERSSTYTDVILHGAEITISSEDAPGPNPYPDLPQTKLTIGGEPAVKQVVNPPIDAQGSWVNVQFAHGNRSYEVMLEYQKMTPELEAAFDAFLASFAFTH